MGEHVTMQKPFAWIVGDGRNFLGLSSCNKRRIPEGPKMAVLVELMEMHSMQMHGMRKSSVVSDIQSEGFTA